MRSACLVVIVSIVLCLNDARAASKEVVAPPDEASTIVAAGAAAYVGILKRTTAGVGLGDFLVMKSSRGLREGTSIVISYESSPEEIPNLGVAFLGVLERSVPEEVSDVYHPIQLRRKIAEYHALKLLPISPSGEFLGEKFLGEQELFGVVLDVVGNRSHELRRRFLTQATTLLCSARPLSDACSGIASDISENEIVDLVLLELSKLERRSQMSDSVSQKLVVASSEKVTRLLRTKGYMFRAPAIEHRIFEFVDAVSGAPPSVSLARSVAGDGDWMVNLAGSLPGVMSAKIVGNGVTVRGFLWEKHFPINGLEQFVDSELSAVAHLAGAVARGNCGNGCSQVCYEWAKSSNPGLLFVSSVCIRPTNEKRARKLLRRVTKDITMRGWAQLISAREGNKEAVDSLLYLLQDVDFLPSLEETLQRSELVSLLINSFAASKVTVEECGRYSTCHGKLRQLWNENRQRMKIADPWKSRLQRAGLE